MHFCRRIECCPLFVPLQHQVSISLKSPRISIFQVDPNMPVQAKIGSLTTIEGLINADKEIPASLVEECFIKNLGRILWKHLEPITPICGTILNILSKIISYGGQDLVQKHLTISLQKLAEKRDIINQANELLKLLPDP